MNIPTYITLWHYIFVHKFNVQFIYWEEKRTNLKIIITLVFEYCIYKNNFSVLSWKKEIFSEENLHWFWILFLHEIEGCLVYLFKNIFIAVSVWFFKKGCNISLNSNVKVSMKTNQLFEILYHFFLSISFNIWNIALFQFYMK